jgi:adenosylcobinamide kinase/adenosylcobinamide-phosphate guanylyltransferase
MGRIIFILGGARSGKSQYALKLVKRECKKVAFIATCLPLDEEMKKRISMHKKTRPSHWQTFEEPKDLPLLLKQIGAKFEVILIDCLTLWLSNLMLKGLKEDTIENKIDNILDLLVKIKAKSIIVSNEVGLGIVPENKLGRDFRDMAGRINQRVAGKSDEVFFMISGIPWKLR